MQEAKQKSMRNKENVSKLTLDKYHLKASCPMKISYNTEEKLIPSDTVRSVYQTSTTQQKTLLLKTNNELNKLMCNISHY